MRVRTTALVVFCLVIPTLAFAQNKRLVPASDATAVKNGRMTIDFHNGAAEEIAAYSFGVTETFTTPTGGGAGTGKTVFQDLNFTKFVSASSSGLFQTCAEGRHIPQVDLTVNSTGPTVTIHLTDVLITSYSQGGGGDRPTESLSLNFSRITFTATP